MIRRNYSRRALLKFASLSLALALAETPAHSYIVETTVPPTGCPAPNHWPVAGPSSIRLRWSASIAPSTVITAAPYATPQQLTEIGEVVQQSLGAWTGVSGVLINSSATPGAVAPIAQIADTNACTNDVESNVDGLNTICFNQSSSAFTNDGVLAFTRVITANAPGATIGSAPPALFAGQILDSDTLFNNTGDVTFATPSALGAPQGVGAYDLESLLTHELGHFFGLDHSGVRRAILYPFAPTPGTFIGQRPTSSAPDAMLSDDDRTGLRVLYPDPADTVHVGTIAGRILPANPFALAAIPAASAQQPVTGIFGTQVVAEDAGTGSIVAATMGGWSCTNGQVQFDGSYAISRLPVPANYKVYVEPLDGLATDGDFYETANGICGASATNNCTEPEANTNFTTRVRPSP